MLASDGSLFRTPLHGLHCDLGARMVPFAGHDMPLLFAGAVAEHLHTRSQASLFDVSHMRICDIVGDGVTAALEYLTPSRLSDLDEGRSRYITLTNDAGGIVDDSIAARTADGVRLVLNASRVDVVLAHLGAHLGKAARDRADLGMLALQGPRAARVLEELGVEVRGLVFMQSRNARLGGVDIELSRSGYTGEDGFELVADGTDLTALADLLLGQRLVKPAGLAARDSLRLEAGLCLYGQELDEVTSPVEAGLTWTIPRDRREGGDYLGAGTVAAQVREGPPRRLVGLRPAGRRPLRAGAALRTARGEGVGMVTSGGWGPTVGGPIAMGYVRPSLTETGTALVADVRGHAEPCEVVQTPFVAHRYVRAAGAA